ncbi:MAG: endonuclease III [Clostridiales bacterium]
MNKKDIKKRNDDILAILAAAYPNAKPALNYKNSYELLVAVLLSAQCTDERVNIVTAVLFKEAPNPYAMVKLGEDNIRNIIKSCGLYKNKAKNIFNLSGILVDKYHGEVPWERENLESLPGIGRKSANVVMNVCFGIPAIAVDTHVFRVSRRLGFSDGKDVLTVEKDLMELIPEEKWGNAHHWLIFHGRKICKAQKPLCDECPLGEICPKLI